MNVKFIRGKIISGSQDLDIVKCWMQVTFPEAYFMECDNGYYFEIPIDNNLFTNPNAFYMYLNDQINKDFAAAPDFYLCLITSCGIYFYETYLHFKICGNITKALYVDETVLDTVYKWLKWDKLHKEYNK